MDKNEHVINLRMLITLLLQYQEHLSTFEQQIHALAKEIKEFNLLLSIPGIGNKIVATILSEIEEIERFDHPKKLLAFVSVDPSVYTSGKFVATLNQIINVAPNNCAVLVIGKANNSSVSEAMGGVFQKKLKAFASALMPETPIEAVRLAEEYAKQGYRAVSLVWDQLAKILNLMRISFNDAFPRGSGCVSQFWLRY